MLITVLFMWLLARFSAILKIGVAYQGLLVSLLMFVGFMITIAAIISFRMAATTVNPLNPERASSLVDGGVFRFTRNPMYLGMLLVLLAWGVYLSSLLNLFLIVGFVWYLTRFQILPEEKAMRANFGETYQTYCQKVRRWI